MHKKIKNIDIEDVKKAVKKCSSKRKVILELNCNPKDATNFRDLNFLIVKHEINIEHYDPMYKYNKISGIIGKSYSFVDVAKNVGLVREDVSKISTRLCRNIKNYIRENNLITSHFRHLSRVGYKLTWTNEQVFSKNSVVSQSTVKKRFIETVKYQCAICSVGSWNNAPLSLQLDHIDGDSKNNLMVNLRLLCPNCHSQTETFGVKNKTFKLVKDSKIKDKKDKGVFSVKEKKNDYLEEMEEKRKASIEAILSSSIDFSQYGWGSKLGKMLGIAPSKSAVWLRKNMPVFYEQNCFKQSPVAKLTAQQKEEKKEQRRKIKSNEYAKIQSLFASGVKRNEIARRYKVHHSSIEYILKKTIDTQK